MEGEGIPIDCDTVEYTDCSSFTLTFTSRWPPKPLVIQVVRSSRTANNRAGFWGGARTDHKLGNPSFLYNLVLLQYRAWSFCNLVHCITINKSPPYLSNIILYLNKIVTKIVFLVGYSWTGLKVCQQAFWGDIEEGNQLNGCGMCLFF